MIRVRDKNIIITGASSGIGECLARNIAQNGGNPIIVARSEEKLKELKQELIETYGVKCYYYVVDLTNSEAWKSTLKQIVADVTPIDAVINNAGFGIFDLVERSRRRDMEKMFQLNVFALIQGIYQILPYMLANKSGHIVNIGSQAGKIATPKSSVYAATKHAVIGFSNSLRLEVENKGIYVTTVNLGPVKTGFFQTADPSGDYQRSVKRYMLNPEDVARKIVDNLFKQKREINLPRWMDVGSRLYQVFPSQMETVLRKQFSKK